MVLYLKISKYINITCYFGKYKRNNLQNEIISYSLSSIPFCSVYLYVCLPIILKDHMKRKLRKLCYIYNVFNIATEKKISCE